MGSASSHKPITEGWTTLAAVPCQLASPCVRQYACSTAAYEHRPVVMPFTLERCRRQRSHCAKDVERCIRYNA